MKTGVKSDVTYGSCRSYAQCETRMASDSFSTVKWADAPCVICVIYPLAEPKIENVSYYYNNQN